MANCDIGIVVPTLGTRPDYLRQCLLSIRSAGDALIHIVMPSGVSLPAEITPDLFDAVITDPGKGLSAAIHVGLQSFPESVLFVNWLGDDDVLSKNSLQMTSSVLRDNSEVSLVFGGCHYVNETGQTIFTNKSGRYAIPLMRVGPQLIPQPGALFRRQFYDEIDGLNSDYKWAFDLDLFIRLAQVGKVVYLKSVLASFRWHADSLSVGGRDGSVREASRIRKTYLPSALRPISEIWEVPIRAAIMRAGARVSRRKAIPIN